MNITDVGHLVSDADEGEDKLEKGAQREGKTAWEVADFYSQDFLKNSDRLGLVTPQHIAKATDFIPQQLELVRTLKAKGFTYQIDDGIYFDTSKFPTYADFAHLNLEALQAGARVKFNPQKRNHSDFALWKFTPAGEKRDMEWQTPSDLLEARRVATSGAAPDSADATSGRESGADSSTGPASVMGFPGWHLECSAMAMRYLGHTMDVHCGGVDLIFPHHEDEIAQSEGATGETFSRFWCHGEFLLTDGSKMAKRVGNVATVADMRAQGISAAAFRAFVFSTHYRKQLNLSPDALDAATEGVRRVGDFSERLAQARGGTPELVQIAADAEREASEALFDDLNAPIAMGALFTFIRKANAELDKGGSDVAGLEAARHVFSRINGVLDIVPDREPDGTRPDPIRPRGRQER